MDTVTVKTSTKFYNTTFPYDMIFTKADEYIGDGKVDKLTRELNIYYRACIESFIFLLSTREDLGCAVQKLAKF